LQAVPEQIRLPPHVLAALVGQVPALQVLCGTSVVVLAHLGAGPQLLVG
jgi:hypothetical protein